MGDVDWAQLLADARTTAPTVLAGATFLKKWATASQPVLLTCVAADGSHHDYVVKGRQAGRMVFNDQVVARLGQQLGAPVGEPALVDVPQALIDVEPEMAHMLAGVSHGTRFLVGYSERLAYDRASEGVNRSRFAALALLFGWIHASDHQFIYENAAPHTVVSVDHGHFLPNGPDWTVASLAGAPVSAPDAGVVAGAALTDEELDEARAALRPLTNEQIAEALVVPPDEWGVSEDERQALARYLADRRGVIFP
jgi:hypothetical protein